MVAFAKSWRREFKASVTAFKRPSRAGAVLYTSTCPATNVFMPAASTSWTCTNTSGPPSSGRMKPNPRSVLKNLILPVGNFSCSSSAQQWLGPRNQQGAVCVMSGRPSQAASAVLKGAPLAPLRFLHAHSCLVASNCIEGSGPDKLSSEESHGLRRPKSSHATAAPPSSAMNSRRFTRSPRRRVRAVSAAHRSGAPERC